MMRLKEARFQKGYTRRELERRAGLSEGYAGRLERGDVRTPRLSTLAKIAFVLGVKPCELDFEPPE